MGVKILTDFYVRFFRTFNGIQNGSPKPHSWLLYLELYKPDFEVGYFYEFVVEFSYILHLNLSF